jgi:hypothetical protein
MSSLKTRLAALEAIPVPDGLITELRMILDGDQDRHDLKMTANGYTKKVLPDSCFTLWSDANGH